jgi:hypothetical protein
MSDNAAAAIRMPMRTRTYIVPTHKFAMISAPRHQTVGEQELPWQILQ